MRARPPPLSFFFFNDTATTEIYTLSLHDALPIWIRETLRHGWTDAVRSASDRHPAMIAYPRDRKSTRLNSSHSQISYAVFCLKKKKTPKRTFHTRHMPTSSTPCSPTPRRHGELRA